MGYEFVADVTGTGDYEAAIRRALVEDPEFEVLPSPSASVVQLRLRASAIRASWPNEWAEDAEVHFRPMQIYVLFHAARAEERACLIDLVERALAEVGCAARLVED